MTSDNIMQSPTFRHAWTSVHPLEHSIPPEGSYTCWGLTPHLRPQSVSLPGCWSHQPLLTARHRQREHAEHTAREAQATQLPPREGQGLGSKSDSLHHLQTFTEACFARPFQSLS